MFLRVRRQPPPGIVGPSHCIIVPCAVGGQQPAVCIVTEGIIQRVRILVRKQTICHVVGVADNRLRIWRNELVGPSCQPLRRVILVESGSRVGIAVLVTIIICVGPRREDFYTWEIPWIVGVRCDPVLGVGQGQQVAVAVVREGRDPTEAVRRALLLSRASYANVVSRSKASFRFVRLF